MFDPICPFASLEPGADWWMNDSRRIDTRAMVVHRPQGTCPGVVSVGVTRHHGSPGTFHFTLCNDGELHQHYPVNVNCSHAAGANGAAFGVEAEDFDGVAPSDASLRTLARLAEWARAEGWIANTDYYNGENGRGWLDVVEWPQGVLSHAAIDYPPNRSYLHYDDITQDEYARGMALLGHDDSGATPRPRGGEVPMVGWVVWANVVHCYLLDPQGRLVREYPQENLNAYGFPADALEGGLPRFRMNGGEWVGIINDKKLPGVLV